MKVEWPKMTLNLELPEELTSRLEAAGIPAEDASRYALAALSEMADRAELRAWWDALSTDERINEAAKTRESVAAADSCTVASAANAYARARASAALDAHR
jgi:hypothetical protein